MLLIVIVIICGFGCVMQRDLIFPAEKLPADHRFGFIRAGEEVRLRASDGVEIDAIHYKRFGSRRVILYCHGNAGSLDSWGTIFEDLKYLETDLIVFDYRGYGKSGGKVTEKGLYRDAQAVYDYLRQAGYGDSDIIVYGRSIGTGVAVDVAQGKHLAGLILESPYHSLRGMLYREYWYMLPWFYLTFTLDNRAKLPKVPARVLILHGTKDDVIAFKYGRMLTESRSDSLAFVPITGGGHNDLDAFPAKRKALEAFLGKDPGPSQAPSPAPPAAR